MERERERERERGACVRVDESIHRGGNRDARGVVIKKMMEVGNRRGRRG